VAGSFAAGYAGKREKQVGRGSTFKGICKKKRMGPEGLMSWGTAHILPLHCVLVQEELLDIIYWMRQMVGVLVGLVWGVIPLYGIVGLLG
jgi:hypothetical protein